MINKIRTRVAELENYATLLTYIENTMDYYMEVDPETGVKSEPAEDKYNYHTFAAWKNIKEQIEKMALK